MLSQGEAETMSHSHSLGDGDRPMNSCEHVPGTPAAASGMLPLLLVSSPLLSSLSKETLSGVPATTDPGVPWMVDSGVPGTADGSAPAAAASM
jgi:hypothetical protein